MMRLFAHRLVHFESERVEVLLADNSNAFDYGHTVELFEQDGRISIRCSGSHTISSDLFDPLWFAWTISNNLTI